MKKAILMVAALLMVVSGIAAVSAYEAHLINVTAHVENALTVDTAAIDFGTVFPQEWLIVDRDIELSESANVALTEGGAAGTLVSVEYKIWAEYKVDPGSPNHTPDLMIGGTDYYKWLGPWLWVGINQADPTGATTLVAQGWTQVGAVPVSPAMAKDTCEGGTLTSDTPDTLKVMLLAPCFHGYYNADTDTKPDWWPTPDTAAWPFLDSALRDGCDLGLDLKVQVTAINRTPAPK